MASAAASTLKGYFNTGDRPTEANFATLIETIGYPYFNGTSAQTADFTAANGYVYLVTKLDGCDITLPVPVVGDRIKIIFGAVTSNAHTITADATSTLFNGYALLGDTLDGTPAQHVVFAPDGSDDDVFSMNGTTTGVSAIVELTATATNRWFAEATVLASGAVSTPWA
jgi:hypothetical protein